MNILCKPKIYRRETRAIKSMELSCNLTVAHTFIHVYGTKFKLQMVASLPIYFFKSSANKDYLFFPRGKGVQSLSLRILDESFPFFNWHRKTSCDSSVSKCPPRSTESFRQTSKTRPDMFQGGIILSSLLKPIHIWIFTWPTKFKLRIFLTRCW